MILFRRSENNVRPNLYAKRIHGARLEPGTLARFADGLTWDGIHALGDGHSRAWWTLAVADAEDRKLLVWSHALQMWRLTPAGRAVTRNVS